MNGVVQGVQILELEYGRSDSYFRWARLCRLVWVGGCMRGVLLPVFRSDFLLYKIVDRVVDELAPIVAAYTYRLKFFQVPLPTLVGTFRATRKPLAGSWSVSDLTGTWLVRYQT